MRRELVASGFEIERVRKMSNNAGELPADLYRAFQDRLANNPTLLLIHTVYWLTTGASDAFGYSYDGLNRLTAVTTTNAESFTLDAAPRTSRAAPGPPSPSPTTPRTASPLTAARTSAGPRPTGSPAAARTPSATTRSTGSRAPLSRAPHARMPIAATACCSPGRRAGRRRTCCGTRPPHRAGSCRSALTRSSTAWVPSTPSRARARRRSRATAARACAPSSMGPGP
jgi:YD repeat-containing protein